MIPRDLFQVAMRCESDGGIAPPDHRHVGAFAYDANVWREWYDKKPATCRAECDWIDYYSYHDAPGPFTCSRINNHDGPHITDETWFVAVWW